MATEYLHTRWHSRGAFLGATVAVLALMGAPALVTQALLQHGALFLPALLLVLNVLGGALVRLELATGQLDHQSPGREAVHGLQNLVRVALAAVLLYTAARAGAWVARSLLDGPPALAYQQLELSAASSSWHGTGAWLLWAGLPCAALLTGLLWLLARRQRLAGLTWLGRWLLPMVALLLVLGVFVGYVLPGAGPLAAAVAAPRWEAPLTVAFWGDAVATALLSLGAHTGVLVAAGRALPQRAAVGPEARTLVAAVGLLLALGGIAGLLLLCGLCFRQGIVPGPEHASAQLLVLELVPALGQDLFPGWDPAWRPQPQQVALGWQFLVLVGCSFAAAGLLVARRFLPPRPGTGPALAGYVAALLAAGGVGLQWVLGGEMPWLPLLTVLPALIAVLRITLARRSGAGLRLASAAFGSRLPWVERLYMFFTFRVVRPALLAGVLGVALANRSHAVVLATLALAFGAAWVGSLLPPEAIRAPARAAAALLALLPAALWAQAPQDLSTLDAQGRARLRAEAFSAAASGRTLQDRETLTAAIRAGLEGDKPPGVVARDRARDLLAAGLALWPDDAELQRLERQLLLADGLSGVRLEEALAEHEAGRPAPLRELLGTVAASLQGRSVGALLEGADEPVTTRWQLALAADLQRAYGPAGPSARELRQYLLRRATAGKSLLRPDASGGGVLLGSFLAAAAVLAIALALASRAVEPARRNG
ncbi:MAG: hypothetical protein IT463_01565 [Planctomycetes bacterium]|nr:hypothetical protein [Planctomycetota bacterium]